VPRKGQVSRDAKARCFRLSDAGSGNLRHWSKSAMDDKPRRKRLAALPFSEKLKILEKMRERDRAIAAARLRKTARPKPDSSGSSKF